MRVKIREVIDITKPINLRTLQPKDKVLAAVKTAVGNSNFFKTGRRKREQEAHRRRLEREEYIKDILLTKVYQSLIKNNEMTQGDLNDKVYIKVNADYKDVLFDEVDEAENLIHLSVLKHSDFSQYNVKFVEEENDLRIAFPEMPFMLEFSRKEV